MAKREIIVFILLFGIILSTLGYCQNYGQNEALKRVRGTVADIDLVASRLVVRTDDFGAIDEIAFVVFEETEITKGGTAIGLSDIDLASAVTVEYSSNSRIGLKAVHITVEE